MQALKDKLGRSCKAVFIGQPAKVSASQQKVSDTLRGMGLLVEDEFRCPKSGYSIDMRVHEMCVNAKSSKGADVGWAVELDGAWHFLACRSQLVTFIKVPSGGILSCWATPSSACPSEAGSGII